MRTDLFWAKVQKTDGCWLWTAHVDQSGYGKFGNGKHGTTCAHRIAYELCVGPIPAGLELDHLCRVRHCVNPRHLEAVTHSENVLRGLSPAITAARQRAKTHCPKKHPYDEANTIHRGGARFCRACRDAKNAARFNKEAV